MFAGEGGSSYPLELQGGNDMLSAGPGESSKHQHQHHYNNEMEKFPTVIGSASGSGSGSGSRPTSAGPGQYMSLGKSLSAPGIGLPQHTFGYSAP